MCNESAISMDFVICFDGACSGKTWNNMLAPQFQ